MKFIEIGIGNTWLVRTETELEDGTEYEEKGIIGIGCNFGAIFIARSKKENQ